MKRILTAALVLALSTVAQGAEKSPLGFTMKDIDGKPLKLSQFKGKVVVLVNVASECGLTPQYEGLQSLYKKYNKKGLVILGVPANEFGRQEPGTDAEIKKFCTSEYNVTFPMLSKVVVKGKGMCDLYEHLTSKETNPKFAGPIRWNFTKFLINRKGEVVERFEPRARPEQMTKAIERELAK